MLSTHGLITKFWYTVAIFAYSTSIVSVLRVDLMQGKLGMLLLSLCYQPTDNTITITIIKARDLKAKDINGLSGAQRSLWSRKCKGKGGPYFEGA